MEKKFINESANINNKKWDQMISRKSPIYIRDTDIRSDFERDYTRIIHSNAYKRLKHKTQVFFSPKNDHICTRIEHVSHVESISYTIADTLGLNTSLTKAIATAHDIGHSPFGHQGEKILNEISIRDCNKTFWHENNGLFFADNIELLEDNNGNKQNLNLTYAVRDGIISHCGEIDEDFLKPRDEYIDLENYLTPNQYSPFTWEGCVVKISDKISYIGRDIIDAISLGILDNDLDELYELLSCPREYKLNNANIINKLIYDLCMNSNPKDGLIISEENLNLLTKIKEFNYSKIYKSSRILPSNKYFSLVINQIYDTLKNLYSGKDTISHLNNLNKHYPKLISGFISWLKQYLNITDRSDNKLQNNILFDINNPIDYYSSIIYYISGMTDNYAIEMYNEIISF